MRPVDEGTLFQVIWVDAFDEVTTITTKKTTWIRLHVQQVMAILLVLIGSHSHVTEIFQNITQLHQWSPLCTPLTTRARVLKSFHKNELYGVHLILMG